MSKIAPAETPAALAFPFRLKSGVATWPLKAPLDVSTAMDLHASASAMLADPKVKRVVVELPPEKGLGTAAYQVLTALQREFTNSGRSVEVTGNLEPFGGRAW